MSQCNSAGLLGRMHSLLQYWMDVCCVQCIQIICWDAKLLQSLICFFYSCIHLHVPSSVCLHPQPKELSGWHAVQHNTTKTQVWHREWVLCKADIALHLRGFSFILFASVQANSSSRSFCMVLGSFILLTSNRFRSSTNFHLSALANEAPFI